MVLVDWAIIIFLLYGALAGFWRGFISQVFYLAGVIGSLFVTFWIFPRVASWFEQQLHIPITYAHAISLLIIFLLVLLVVQFALKIVQRLFAPILSANPLNRGLGALLGTAKQALLASIILALLVTLPTPEVVKQAITQSRFASPLINFAFALEKSLHGLTHEDALTSLSFRMVGSDSRETTALNFTDANPTEDLEGEAKLLAVTEAVRNQDKKPVLVPNLGLQDVARQHAKDMLAKGYFSHLTPDGKDAMDRVLAANVKVSAVGENLALAPTIDLAQAGLYASPGHRQNMLNSDYNQVGIAVLDSGAHGKMVVEVFAHVE